MSHRQLHGWILLPLIITKGCALEIPGRRSRETEGVAG
jgi:hypothetical protein